MMTCPLCGGTTTTELGRYRNLSVELAGKHKVQCGACDLVFAAPMPTEDEWATYNANYFARAHGQSAETSGAKLFRSGLAKLRVRHVLAELERRSIAVKTVLEIGPGHGEFIAAFKAERPDVTYLAQETDRSVFGTLTSLGAQILSVEDVRALPRTVDLVVISHVLEHTIDPLSFLAESTAPLRDGGVLFVEVPCRDDLYKSEDEPHLLFFDKPAMNYAMEQAGFGEVMLSYHGASHSELEWETQQSWLMALLKRMVRRARRILPAGHERLSGEEWAVVGPFKAERLSATRARWLRSVAARRADANK